MKLIEINEYNSLTMQLARPIYDAHKRVLLGAGRRIHPHYLDRIKELDIRYIFVEDAESEGISIDEVMEITDWVDRIQELEKALENINTNGTIDFRRLTQLAAKLEYEVSSWKLIMLVPSTSLPKNKQKYAHAINVTLLSLTLAKTMKLSGFKIRDLAIGALLHDIGKDLGATGEEHCKVGFEFLRKFREISVVSAHIAYQHHEQYDGIGYPRGLKEREIHELAQICSISDMYENLISRGQVPFHEALEAIMTTLNSKYPNELVQHFVDTIPTYIPGTKVRLNNNVNGIVTKITTNLHRPHVRNLLSGEEVSLADLPTILISEVLINN